MRNIHPSATIESGARLPDDVVVGPGCFVSAGVTLGDGCRLMQNVVILGRTTIGANNVFYPNCVIGANPQDLKHGGEETQLVIGDRNVFREHVTVHTGTVLGGGITRIGSSNQLQIGSHIAHDVTLGDHCVLSNQVQIAGHVVIEDHVTISGMVGVHQFVTFGKYCFVAGMARCEKDVPPFLIYGYDGSLGGVNVRGLMRWGFTEEECERLKRLYRLLFPRRGREGENGGMRNWYGMLFSRRARRSAMSLSRRIHEAESNGALDENCRYLIEFMKRSLEENVYGRHLETKRRDSGIAPPKFFTRQESVT
ncbi:MAG: acyl-ACP--UDP-N-acetylglucosamine O-acyltransferase [Phycisphaerae bacterium]|nr:acyl-ACP--UDP-N-acetylglucosamine O-acyltransferase [Phycisphaerae bacterium]